MKIELRNLKVNLAFSEETTMFQADVYVDGKKTAHANNDGHGGCTFYHAYKGMESQLKKAEKYAASLPSIKHHSITIPYNLELLIDLKVEDEVNKKEKAKLKKKIEKLCLNHIVWGIPDGDQIFKQGLKGSPMFSDVMKHPQGKFVLANMHNRIKKELKKGEVIFNTNL